MFSIIVPCYNEEKNLPLILEAFTKVVDAREDIELILVNNGSTDGSSEVLGRLVPNVRFARTIEVYPNQGYGFGVLSGLKEARGEYLGWTHADMQANPEDVIKAFALIAGKKQTLVKGSRKNRPWSAQLITRGMGIFESLLFQRWIYEINAQPTVFHKSFLAELSDAPQDFALDLYTYVRAKQLRYEIVHFPVFFPPRIHGESSWDTSPIAKMRAIMRTIKYSLRLRFICR